MSAPRHPNNSFLTSRPTDPCALVLFGASGDLAKRKLLPTLYFLAKNKILPDGFALVGFSRTPWGDQEYRDKLTQDIKEFTSEPLDQDVWQWLLKRSFYQAGEFQDLEAFKKLGARLQGLAQGTGGNAAFYLATLPQFFSGIARQLATAGLTQEKGFWRRLVVEKPFGRDLPSARQLNADLAQVLAEDQIYRIDHYLGKETVRNILALRFGNGIFEPIWNRRYVDHVQITVAEDLGVEHRAPYYETAGALRDMVPNHLCQLISLTAMEPPVSFDARAVRDEKAKLLRAVQPMTHEEVQRRTVRGQYGPGTLEGKPVPGYRQEPWVNPESPVETFAAFKLLIDNWRWEGVPFYLRTGKRLARRYTEVVISFKRPPLSLFRHTAVSGFSPNQLVLHIQPEEGVSLSFGAKVPGPQVQLDDVQMNFNYCDYFGCESNTGYETLLYDVMIGDATQFQRADMIEAGWSMVQPVLEVWAHQKPDFPNYAAGSWGPPEAEQLLKRDGREWRT